MSVEMVPTTDKLRAEFRQAADLSGLSAQCSQYTAFCSGAPYLYWTLMHDGKAAGEVCFYPTSHYCWLDVFVTPQAQGKWASRRIFRQIADIAFSQYGANVICVVTKNPRSARILAQQGFIPYATDEAGICFALYKGSYNG